MENFKQLFGKYKAAIIGIVILFGAYYAYTNYFVQEDSGYLRSENKEIIDSEVGQRIVNMLNRLKTISIDVEFFTDSYFQTLVDYSRDLGVPQKSKENPFLPPTEATTLTVVKSSGSQSSGSGEEVVEDEATTEEQTGSQEQ